MKRSIIILAVVFLSFVSGVIWTRYEVFSSITQVFNRKPADLVPSFVEKIFDWRPARALPPYTESSINFRLLLRQLWEYDVIWTGRYVVSVMSGLDDVAVVKKQLVKNQEIIGDIITPYYGGWAGNRLSDLLQQHILIAMEIVKATKNGDVEALNKAKEKGRNNADNIAGLFALARNPLWEKQTLKDIFYQHLEYLAMQADLRLKKDYAAEVKVSDEAVVHALKIAALLAEGMIKQFPKKFKQ